MILSFLLCPRFVSIIVMIHIECELWWRHSNFIEMQDIDFICTGKVTEIKVDKGWCYVSCSKCFKKLHRSVSSLTCLFCNNTNAVGVLRSVLNLSSLSVYAKLAVLFDTFILCDRYRVEMSIADKTGEGLFVAFDGVMAKLHNMRAHEAANLLVRSSILCFICELSIHSINRVIVHAGW